MALGIHAINNLYGVFVTFPSSVFAVSAMITIKSVDQGLSLVVNIVTILVYLMLLYLIKPAWMRGEA